MGLALIRFTADAWSDIDGGDQNMDGTVQASFGYIKPVTGAMVGLAGTLTGCPAAGIFNPVTMLNDLLDTVGPCDNNSGQSEF